MLLCCSAVVLIATAAFHTWWARRHENAPPPTDTGTAAPRSPGAPQEEWRETALWRMRTTVQDEPGSLAALCTALAEHRVDILNLQTHPLSDGTVDEFLLRAPAALLPADLTRTVAAGGRRAHLAGAGGRARSGGRPTRILGMATRTALDSAELPLALRQLLGRCTIRSVPARTRNAQRDAEPVPEEGILEEHTMTLP
ncbi:GNAT family N-acetyltransferase OS=Streptomyces rimosus subsp. rimosus (strain ATCC / DSM 40260/ JCM 4667 / NRRL 2234) OX=1265868 GN=SRIM_003885 PE=4 SV=1 [Streptomyces rimosus subsp. rimosus]